MDDLFQDSINWTPGMSASPLGLSGPRGQLGVREETVWIEKAARLLTEQFRSLRTAALFAPTLKFKRLIGGFRHGDGELQFEAVLYLARPIRHCSISIPVTLSGGEPVPPTHFKDSAGRTYMMTEGALRGLMTDRSKTWIDSRKLPPRADIAMTDRTLMPEVPARSFFTLANRW